MKKTITLILLLIFCIEPACWATEIIIGTDGQARYADGTETSLVRVKSKTERVIIEESIMSKTEMGQLTEQYNKNNIAIVKNAKKEINYKKAFAKYEKQSGSSKTFTLQDGDYAIWPLSSKSTQYAAEFHQDNSQMGIIEIQKINRNTVVFYEYRIDSEKTNTAFLKHIMIVYNDEHKAAFIYTADKKLRCCQYQGKIYAIDLPSMPEVFELNLSYIESMGDEALSNMGEIALTILQAPLLLLRLPLILIGVCLYVLYLPFAIFMAIKTKNTSWFTLDLSH